MPNKATLVPFVLVTVFGMGGCSDEEAGLCVAETYVKCTCPDGAEGFQGCEPGSGYVLPCECSTALTDAGAADATADLMDGGGVEDVAAETGPDAVLADTPSDATAEDVTPAPDAPVDAVPDAIADADVQVEPDTSVTPSWVPLFGPETSLEPPLQEETEAALITRFSDRARDRHAREDEFQAYDHYLSFYWEHRTVTVEIIDTVAKGGDTITFKVASQWKLSSNQAELRFFYRGHNTVAEYFDNAPMMPLDTLNYTRSVSFNPKTGAPLAVGDRMEFELSQFLDAPPNGRSNYYGTAFLYIVGQGLVPWEAQGVFQDFSTALEDSFPIPEMAWAGGATTLHYAYSGEDDGHFMQMPTNLAPDNGQVFVEGRRVHHTDMLDGSHNESPDNPTFQELNGVLGSRYINRSCVSCHARNGRAIPPEVGQPLDQYVIKVGDQDGGPSADVGAVLQPGDANGASEGIVTLSAWTESDGLRAPVYAFAGAPPAQFSARIAPQLVGMGLLEAIPEAALEALADPDDADGDGISGRLRIVTDPETQEPRVGRFGWKAGKASVRHQVAGALNTDMGVMSSVFPQPDCGSAQADCAPGAAIPESHLATLVAYNRLLGVRPRRNLNDPVAQAGEAIFTTAGCAACHTPTFQTSPHHPHAELRDQAIAPYTDLLLHDMGPGLADPLAEGDASGSEWRTTPLWSIGLTAGVSGAEAYLHDGRARTLTEAILWHGGEGDASREAFEALDAADKAALLAFVRSL